MTAYLFFYRHCPPPRICEATIRQCRIHTNRILRAALLRGLTPQALVAGFASPASPDLEVEA